MSTEIRSTKSCFINSISSCLCQIALICLLNKFEHIYAKECQIQKSQVLNPLKSSSAKTEIDLFQNAPEFEVEFYNISIVENLPNGFSVLQVTAHDNERAQNAELTYELEDNSGAFSIDPNSGWLIVKNELILDREKRSVIKMKVFAMKKMPSITNTKNVVNFSNIVCSPTPPVSFVNVEVMILDVNDNTPIFFPSNHYELIVESDSKIGKVIGKVYADDRDQGNNGIVSYRLQKTGNVTYGYPFAVDTYTGEISVTQSPMSVGKHVIFIEAVDNPLNPSEKRFSLAVVTIQVIQSSVFMSGVLKFIGEPYKFSIGIDVPIGSIVGQILLNNAIKTTYVFDLLHNYKNGVPFAVEENSGTITVVDEIRKFKQLVYEFEAVIIDNNDIILITNVTINVEINFNSSYTDNNIVKLNKISNPERIEASQVFHINENSDNLFIGRVQSVTSKSIKYLIANQDIPEINVTSDGFLYANYPLDRETKENYSITITGETLDEIEIIHITLIVDDENDNAPIFNLEYYEGYILENSPTGTEVLIKNKIFAFDKDNGINGTFILDLRDDGNGDSLLYEIEKNNGRIFYKGISNHSLDREMKSIYSMKIVAIDKGNLQSEASLIIKIKDVNDNAPNFTQIRITADHGIRLLGDTEEGNSTLTADNINLIIHKEKLDQGYDLIYYDSFKKIKKLQRPILNIPENVTLGTTILQLKAYDKDVDENADITYSILSEEYNNEAELRFLYGKYFVIGPQSGEISAVQKLLPDMAFSLYVRATDGGNLTDHITLKIHTTYVDNLNIPKEIKQKFNISLFQVGAIMLSCIVFIATFAISLYLKCTRISKRTKLKPAAPSLSTNLFTNNYPQRVYYNFEQLSEGNFQLGQNTYNNELISDTRLPSASTDVGKKFVTSETSLYSCGHDSGVFARMSHCNNIYNSDTSSRKSSNSYEDSLKSFQQHSLTSNIESLSNYPTQAFSAISNKKQCETARDERKNRNEKKISKEEHQCNIFSEENYIRNILIQKQQQPITELQNPNIFMSSLIPSGTGIKKQVLY